MKYLIPFIFAIGIFCFSFTLSANCVIDGKTASQFLSECGKGTQGVNPGSANTSSDDLQSSIRDYITNIANSVISFGALLAVGAIVWAGIQYTKAYGEEEKLKKAKTTGIYAFIGLILLMAAFGLIDIFINFIYTASS